MGRGAVVGNEPGVPSGTIGWRFVVLVAAGMLAVSLTACVRGGQDAATTPSVPSSFVATDEVADVMEVDVPEGWVEFPPDPPLEYFASPEGLHGSVAAAIVVTRYGPSAIGVGTNESYSLESLLIDTLQSRIAEHDVTDVEVLPARFIDGNPARGYRYIATDVEVGEPVRYEYWEVGRHDGLWSITLKSAPGETELPPELDGVLDTVTWGEP